MATENEFASIEWGEGIHADKVEVTVWTRHGLPVVIHRTRDVGEAETMVKALEGTIHTWVASQNTV